MTTYVSRPALASQEWWLLFNAIALATREDPSRIPLTSMRLAIPITDPLVTHPDIEERVRYWVQQHEVLRSTFECSSTSAYSVQNIRADAATTPIAVCDAQDVHEVGSRAFDLSTEGPARFAVAVDTDGAKQLHVFLHHVAADGWAAAIAARELTQAMAGGTLPAAAAAPSDLALEQRLTDEGRQRMRDSAEFWDAEFARLPPYVFSQHFGGPKSYSRTWGTLTLSSPQLRSLCARHRCTPDALFVSAYAFLVAAMSDARTVGMFVARANRPEVRRWPWITNLAAMRPFIAEGDHDGLRYADVLAQAQDWSRASLRHPDYDDRGFFDGGWRCAVTRTRRAPVLNQYLSSDLTKSLADHDRPAELSDVQVATATGPAHCDLDLWERGGNLVVQLTTDSAWVPAADAATLLQALPWLFNRLDEPDAADLSTREVPVGSAATAQRAADRWSLVRGTWIDLAGLTATVRSAPGVLDAVVKPASPESDWRLDAELTAEKNAADADAVRAHVVEHMPMAAWAPDSYRIAVRDASAESLPQGAPEESSEHDSDALNALMASVRAAGGAEHPRATDSLLGCGITAVMQPAMLAALGERGFRLGLSDVMELGSGRPLYGLATLLHPL